MTVLACLAAIRRSPSLFGGFAYLVLWIGLLGGTLAAQSTPPSRRADQTLVLVLTTRGFQQESVSIPGGRVFFSVHNRTLLPELTFQLERVAGERLRTVPSRPESRNWREVVELTPGEYVLRVEENPAWRVQIMITPPGSGN